MMHQRLMFGLLVYAGVVALIVLRILYLAAFGDHAGAKRGLTALVPERGDIVDRDGQPLARTIDAWTDVRVSFEQLYRLRSVVQNDFLRGDTTGLAPSREPCRTSVPCSASIAKLVVNFSSVLL